jgi:ATP-dependent helicase HrpB
MDPLPIDAALPAVVAAVRRDRALVLTAPPGSGKTTRVPPALADAGLGEVWVLEPRRLAARGAARRVAAERGSVLGGEVGYVVRHERRVSAATRIRFVTEGVLLRALVHDPFLDGVGAVVLDEFHERHLEGDLGLAMLREVRATVRPELALVVMSATLDPAPLLAFLGCSELRVEGTLHPVRTVHEAVAERRPLELRVRDAVARALAETRGDVLVFLPGVREIEDTAAALAGTAARADLLVLPLHGQLDLDEQDRAVLPQRQRKVVLSTNVAESSLTIEGVTAVVDSGLARVLRHDAGSGLERLVVERISLASADQRRGRAGRVEPGVCWRLWTAGEERRFAAFDTPEVRRADLARPALAVRAFAGREPAAFGWFETPEPAALARADGLLALLGAIDAAGAVTRRGRAMLDLPLHPRLAGIVLAGRERGCARLAATLAALLGERDLLRRDADAPGAEAESGLDLRLQRFAEAEAARFAAGACRRLGVDARAARAVARARDQIAGGGGPPEDVDAETLAGLLLAGFPDRVAKRTGTDEAAMVGGRLLRLLPGTLPPATALLLAVALRDAPAGAAGKATAALAVALERAWLARALPDAVTVAREEELDEDRGRVLAVQRTRYHDLVLDQARGGEPDPDRAAAALAALLQRDPWRWLGDARDLRRLVARVRWLRERAPELELPALADADLVELLRPLLAGRNDLAFLRHVDAGALVFGAHPRLRAVLEREAPSHLRLPSGRSAPIDYDAEGGPAVAARMQEWFGLPAVPPVARGKVPLVLHLLAPNQRPVQITRDLASFWQNVYPKARAELMRRYPRHSWPEDPLRAAPEARPRRRR